MRLALLLTLVLASTALAAPGTLTVPVTLTADQAAVLTAWTAIVAAREGRAVLPQEAAAALLGEKLMEIHQLSLRAEAERQQQQAIRDKAALTPGVKKYQKKLAEEAAKALAEAAKQR